MDDAPEETPVYTISVAARLTSLPVHTLRWLEMNGLCKPARTEGRQRLFSDRDIEFLQEVADLLERKVNLAGIRVILKIKRTYSIDSLALPEDDRGTETGEVA